MDSKFFYQQPANFWIKLWKHIIRNLLPSASSTQCMKTSTRRSLSVCKKNRDWLGVGPVWHPRGKNKNGTWDPSYSISQWSSPREWKLLAHFKAIIVYDLRAPLLFWYLFFAQRDTQLRITPRAPTKQYFRAHFRVTNQTVCENSLEFRGADKFRGRLFRVKVRNS